MPIRASLAACRESTRAMADSGSDQRGDTALKTKVVPKVARPPLHKVILLNDDYTPREFVVRLLKAEFRVPEAQAQKIMLTAHQKGACVVAVFTREIAETKATRATDAARSKGYPLLFTTEPEE
jgi:ATP-dependent Clp protease adaptor protein ClpS